MINAKENFGFEGSGVLVVVSKSGSKTRRNFDSNFKHDAKTSSGKNRKNYEVRINKGD